MRHSALLGFALSLLIITPAIAIDKGIDVRAKGAPATTSAGTPRRLALVVGNSAYRFSGALANPARDAELIAKTLKGVGFELHGGGAQLDLSRAALDQAIEGFGEQIRSGDVALFYYSGHGVQVNGENYLVPVDADLKTEAEVRVKTVPVNLLFAKLEGVPGAVNLVILDACRNNPFARSFRSSGGGLASVSAPTGTLVAFSTSPGQVAEDGSGSNSTYTAALARTINEPGLQVEEVFKQVRSTVTGTTQGRQTPWENTSLTGNFRFIEGDALALKKAALAAGGKEKAEELAALQRMEVEAAKQKEKDQAEIARREVEVAQIDAQIAEMKSRLGSPAARGGDNLQNLLAMVRKREEPAKKLETLRKESEVRRRATAESDIKTYEEIVNSPYGRDLSDAAWQNLLGKYPQVAEVDKGDVPLLRLFVVEGAPLAEVRQYKWIKKIEQLRPLVGKLVPVSGGCYQMGSNNSGEKPVHEVCVSDFAIGQTEVTQGQWRQVMGNNPSGNSLCGDTCPVETVSWNDSQDYLRALNAQTGQNFRLPTEAEWEYAARSGGKAEAYSGGDNVDSVAWYGENSSSSHPVGQKQANGLGLYDMSGNVWEWCQDWKGSYPATAQKNPQGPATGSSRVNRGGCWGNLAAGVRATYRSNDGPGYRDDFIGLRLVLPSVQQAQGRQETSWSEAEPRGPMPDVSQSESF